MRIMPVEDVPLRLQTDPTGGAGTEAPLTDPVPGHGHGERERGTGRRHQRCVPIGRKTWLDSMTDQDWPTPPASLRRMGKTYPANPSTCHLSDPLMCHSVAREYEQVFP